MNLTPWSGGAARPYAERRVLVLGSTGFIGRWIVRMLAQERVELHLAMLVGEEPPVMADGSAERHVHAVDFSEPGVATALVHDVGPDIVINAAGYGVAKGQRDPALANAINVRLPVEVASALGGVDRSWAGARLVHVGSGAEYGGRKGALPEDGPDGADDFYGASKLEGTRGALEGARAAGIPAVVARLFTVYGEGEHPGRLLPTLLEAVHHGERVPLSGGSARRDFTYVEDVARGLLLLGQVSPPADGIVNLCTGRLASVREFVETAARVLDIPSHRLGFGELPPGRFDVVYGPVTTKRCRSLLGWVPDTTVEEGIRRTAAWISAIGSRH